jgi:hypothetical protein
MQSRFTARGLNNENKEVILAFELLEEAVQVNLHIVPKQALSPEQVQQLEKEWVEGGQFTFPDETVFTNPDLNSDSILPDDIKSEETGKIRGKQNEWAYRLLTNKLWEVYLIELASLKHKAAELTAYSRELFDEAKSFWERVLEHKKERDISQAKLDEIKEEVNRIFETLKELRKKESSQFEESSAAFKNELVAKIDELKSRMVEGAMFKDLFEELKQLQATQRGKRLTKFDETNLKKAFDAAFQQLQEARNNFTSNKNASRIENLTKIVTNLEKSLQRDKSDFDYYTKKINHPKANALEIQLAKLKLKMIEEAISSKEEKIADIHKTLDKLKAPKRKNAAVAPASGTVDVASTEPSTTEHHNDTENENGNNVSETEIATNPAVEETEQTKAEK